jgi:predicted nucleic acid-binding protein
MALIDSRALSAGLRLADALIAATAIEHQLSLLTGNSRHFSNIDTLNVETFVA